MGWEFLRSQRKHGEGDAMTKPKFAIPSDPSDAYTAIPPRRVLMLCHRVPFPLDRGDRIRGFHILEHLSRRCDVSIACMSEEPVTKEQLQALYRLADRVAVKQISPRYSKLRGIASLVGGGAVTPAYFYRSGFAKTLLDWHRADPFDAVLTYCTGMIHYARRLTAQDRVHQPTLSQEALSTKSLRHVIDLVDVDSAKWLDYARHSRGPMRWVYRTEAERLRRIEAGKFDYFDGVTVVSDAEARVYSRHVGYHPRLTVLRHAVDLDYFKPIPDAGTKSLLFMGVLNYKPNAEGITWFVNRVMPLLRKRVPGAKLKIIGRHVTPAVQSLGRRAGVEVIGSVPDVRDYLKQASAVIAPLRIARGVQTKVLEAMASGRVAVCSPGAADGIEASDGKHLLVADSPKQWVDQLQRVIADASWRGRLAQSARRQVERVYPWEQCLEPLGGLLGLGGQETRRAGYPVPDRASGVVRDLSKAA